MDNKPLKFHVFYSGADDKWHASCSDIEYDLTFETREDAYHHAKKAEYEFNLIREKQRKEETP